MTKSIRAIFAAFLMVMLSACGGGGGSPGNTNGVALFTTAASKLVISPGETQTYSIGGGVPSYSATSNSGAAIVSVNGKVLTITGGGGGSATVTVKDGAGASVAIDVTVGTGVDLYTTAPSAVVVGVGMTSSVYFIGGGTQIYAVSSSNSQIASVGINRNQFVINGVAGGKATVTVKDSLGKSVSIDVIVGSSDALFTTAATDVTLAIGAANSYTVGGGTTTYTASSSNTSVATAKIVGNNLVITGIDTGKATVIVHDTGSGSATINVTVGTGVVTPLFTTSAADLVVAPSTSPTFTIGGGKAPYFVSTSNATVATVTVSGNTLTVNGLALGSAKVTVTDTAGTPVSINVTVGTGSTLPLFTTAPSAVTVNTGTTVPYSIGGGVAPYTVTSSNVGVATVTVSGSDFSITGVTAGSAKIVIVDSAGKSVSIDLTVAPAASSALDVLPAGATGSVGDTLTFRISGGSPGYSVTNNNPSIATITPTTVASGGSFTAKLLNVGSTIVTIVDTQGQSKTITIVANQASSLLRLSPAILAISEKSTNAINLSIYGGSAPYTAYTSDTTFGTVSTSGNTFTVAVPVGTRCVAANTDVTLTVVDSLGASATSKLTVTDNNGAAGC